MDNEKEYHKWLVILLLIFLCGAECDLMNCGCLDQEVSEKKNINIWRNNHSCDILVKNVAAFCPCLKGLPKAKVKSFELIPLAEEISKQPSIDSAVWLLVLTLMKIYNEKEQAEQGKIFGEKMNTN